MLYDDNNILADGSTMDVCHNPFEPMFFYRQEIFLETTAKYKKLKDMSVVYYIS
jgi:hypothetical protein